MSTTEHPPDIAQRAAEVATLRALMRQSEAVMQRIVVDTVVQEALDTRAAGQLFGISHMTVSRWVGKLCPDYFEQQR